MKKVQLFESFVAEGFEVHYSDGVRAAKKFKTEKDALSFTKEKIASGKCKEIAIYKDGPGFHSTADTDAVVAWWGDGSYLDNVSKKDTKLAAKKLDESVVTEAKAKGLDWVISELGDKPKCYNVASFVYDNYDKVTGLRKSMRNDEMDFPDEIIDVVDHYGLDIDEFTDCYGMAAESVVTEATKFKNTKNFEDFLEEIDGMGEAQIKKIMGKDYIDTPGNYSEEAEDYDNDIVEYMLSNMGKKDLEKLQDWWEANVAESVVTEGVVSIKGGRIIAHKVLNKLVDMDLIPVRKKTEDLLEVIAKVITDAKMESVEVNEAMFGAKDFQKTLITYAVDPKADEIYIIKVDTVIKSGFPDPTKVSDKRFHGMFGMMLEENWMKQYDKLPEVGDILPAPKKDKAFESVVYEGAISDIHIMAQEAKDFKSFVKEFKKEHHDLSKAGEPGQFEAWLKSIYDDAKESMGESVVTEGKDDFMARHSGTDIWLKKGYKHHNEDELQKLYFKIGELLKDELSVKSVSVVFEGKTNEAVAPAGLTKAETKKVAETYAKAISKHDGCKCTVNAKSLEEDSFDLDIDGEAYAGGSYMITADGDVINAALPEKPVYGQIDSTVDQIIKNLKK